MYEPGIRVMAVSHTDARHVYIFGRGVYEGDFVPDAEAAGPFKSEFPNPRIRLDSGKIVWGCECWWGPEEKVGARFKELQVVEVDIDQAREEYRKHETSV